ncbi:Hypothetical protein R9X50_00696400 [Acrodontium crateriforme]|uniref:Cytokinesis regulator n=1 Tax=Acrodontium crateriforme TaxID=150365 RepID=A0AAQ3RAE0_9PEZI|nr:Hypothetical protein R9X50_00696400 [Acrodontium crateriforme]
MAIAVEHWDDDVDFQGDFHLFAANSVGTAPSHISSRLSVRSGSQPGDDDWNLPLQPNDEFSTKSAVQSAKQAGIPIPSNVPASALLGGTIKRLGKKNSRQKVTDDWDNDLEMPDSGTLTLKPRAPKPQADDMDDFDELEGSLGVRFAGTARDSRNRSSSVSVMSPSMGSVTAESEDDDLRGLELPDEGMDFDAILKKRRAAEAELSDISQASPALERSEPKNTHKKSKLVADDNDDFLDDFDLGAGDILDVRKRTINKNLKMKPTKPISTYQRPATTLNFHDKPTDKPVHLRSHLPRPVSGSKARLEPVFETGASHMPRERRQPTTTSSQLLRSKRSMPALRSQPLGSSSLKPSAPFLPAGISSYQHQTTQQRAMPYHLRRESDPSSRSGTQSPPPRPTSRLSSAYTPETPSKMSRPRADVAPATLAREAAAKRNLTRPARRRNFGDGSELEIFDDLPTSTAKESKYVKQPIARGPPRLGLRPTQSRGDLREPNKRSTIPERMTTPAPRTPASPTKGFVEAQNYTPSYLRDTAASRIARESRTTNNTRPRSDGPLMPVHSNWKAQVAARSPITSPNAVKSRVKRPTLIKNMGSNVAKTEKGMVYNPLTLRWEGNENTLEHFDIPPPIQTPTPTGRPFGSALDQRSAPSVSPPRPALIAPMSAAATQGVQVNGGMVFDPRQMKWLKFKDGRDVSGPMSPSVTDGEEEDAFAGIDDLPDENVPITGPGSAMGGMASPVSMAAAGVAEVHEEFDLGPRFIQIQKEEETLWRKRCENWFPNGECREENNLWRYAIRAMVSQEQAEVL